MIIAEGRRLTYYQTKADAKFWDSHWSGLAKTAEWEKAEAGFLGWFEEPFTKYLPKAGKIIEAGCGLGYYVLALGRRGYDIEGVEWSRKAVGLVKQRYPKLKVRIGDVRKLPVKDGYYSGYISLGVVEHDRKGPEKYLAEAYRVLRRGGAALVSVPHFNLLRRIKEIAGCYRGEPDDLDFYQYAFTEAEIDSLIEKAGFKVVDHFRYDAYKGIKEELPFLRNMLVPLKIHFLLSFRARLPTEKCAMSRVRIEPEGEWQTKAGHGIYMDSRFRGNDMVGNSIKRPWWLKLAERYCGHMTMVICVKE